MLRVAAVVLVVAVAGVIAVHLFLVVDGCCWWRCCCLLLWLLLVSCCWLLIVLMCCDADALRCCVGCSSVSLRTKKSRSGGRSTAASDFEKKVGKDATCTIQDLPCVCRMMRAERERAARGQWRDGVRFGWLVTQSQRVVAHHRDLVIRLSRRQRHCSSQLLGHNARLLLVTLFLPGFPSPRPPPSPPLCGPERLLEDELQRGIVDPVVRHRHHSERGRPGSHVTDRGCLNPRRPGILQDSWP